MDSMRSLRHRSEGYNRVEMQLRQDMTVRESLHTWAKLQNAYAWQLEQTASLYEQAHRENLVGLQARIHKLIE
jgi:hypothetical protein